MQAARASGSGVRARSSILVGRMSDRHPLVSLALGVWWAISLVLTLLGLTVIFVVVAPINHPFIVQTRVVWAALIGIPTIVVFSALRDLEPLANARGVGFKYWTIRLTLAAITAAVAVSLRMLFSDIAATFILGALMGMILRAMPPLTRWFVRKTKLSYQALAAALTMVLVSAPTPSQVLVNRLDDAPFAEHIT